MTSTADQLITEALIYLSFIKNKQLTSVIFASSTSPSLSHLPTCDVERGRSWHRTTNIATSGHSSPGNLESINTPTCSPPSISTAWPTGYNWHRWIPQHCSQRLGCEGLPKSGRVAPRGNDGPLWLQSCKSKTIKNLELQFCAR